MFYKSNLHVQIPPVLHFTKKKTMNRGYKLFHIIKPTLVTLYNKAH